MQVLGLSYQAKYTGPFTVAEKISDLDYLIATRGWKKSKRVLHVNLLKLYYERVTDLDQAVNDSVRPTLVVSSVSVTHEGDGVPEPDDSLLYSHLKNSESLYNLL